MYTTKNVPLPPETAKALRSIFSAFDEYRELHKYECENGAWRSSEQTSHVLRGLRIALLALASTYVTSYYADNPIEDLRALLNG